MNLDYASTFWITIFLIAIFFPNLLEVLVKWGFILFFILIL